MYHAGERDARPSPDKGQFMPNIDFQDSQEAAFRRAIRRTIAKGPFTKSEKAVALAFFNHWFFHRKYKDGIVYPGRERIAKKADVSIKTVSNVFSMLRHYGVLIPHAHLNGLQGNATEYSVNHIALLDLCTKKRADLAYNGEQKVPSCGRAKITHRSCDVINFPSQDLKQQSGGRNA